KQVFDLVRVVRGDEIPGFNLGRYRRVGNPDHNHQSSQNSAAPSSPFDCAIHVASLSRQVVADVWNLVPQQSPDILRVISPATRNRQYHSRNRQYHNDNKRVGDAPAQAKSSFRTTVKHPIGRRRRPVSPSSPP